MAFEHLFEYDHGMTITEQHPATPLAGDPLLLAQVRVDAALDQLAAMVAHRLTDDVDPLAVAGWARRVEARVAAVRLVALGEAERRGAARAKGALGTAAWLSGQGVAPGVARRDVALAGALADPDHEGTRDRLASGGLTPEHAIVITRAKDALSDGVSVEQRAAFEKDLLEAAQTNTPQQLETAARRAAARVDPTGSGDLERLERAARARREFTMTRRGGMYVLGGQIDTEGAAYVSAALGPLSAPRPSSADGPDPRTYARRMGDALVDLARRHLNTGDLPETGGLPTQVIVTMTLDQLEASLDTDDAPGAFAENGAAAIDAPEVGAAELTGGTVQGPISAARARRLACDARVLPAVLGGASVVLDLGSNRRTASRAQRIALALRDGGCTAPFCDRPAPWCEAHHLVPWLVSRCTDLDNLVLVCDAHHDLLHHDGWTITLENGQAIWHPPPRTEPPPTEPLAAEPPRGPPAAPP